MTTFTFDQNMEDRFVKLIEESWRRYDDIERNGWIDDVFVGSIVTCHLDNGMFLLSAGSDGQSHYLLFSNLNRDRNIVRVDHTRGEDYLFSKTVGHLTAVTLGVGRAYPDLAKIMRAAKSEIQSDLAGEGRIAGMSDPGVMKVDWDNNGIATCETSLLLDLQDYVSLETFKVDREKLWLHFQATYQSLEKYLSGIMQ
jgi:hypothetical protein